MPLFIGRLLDFHLTQFKPKKFSPLRAFFSIIACLNALKSFHESTKHAHLDLKIDNIMYDEQRQFARLFDMDFSQTVHEDKNKN